MIAADDIRSPAAPLRADIIAQPRGVETIVEVLRWRAENQGERMALRVLALGGEEAEALDYRTLDRRARSVAARLQRVASPGDRALILLPSGPDYVVAFFGCLYAGLVAVPAYPPEALRSHHVDRLAGMVDDAAPRLALTDAEAFAAVEQLCARFDGLRVERVADLQADPDPGWHPGPIAGRDLAFLQYTSGSTSAPKGVEVTHANLVHNQRILMKGCGITPDDVFVSWLPLYHDMGLIAGLVLPLFAGVPLTLMPAEHFLARPARWMMAIQRYGGTVSGGPDFAFRLATERVSEPTLRGLDLSSWRVAFCGAEPVRADTLRNFAARFGSAGFSADAFHPSYGLAETTLLVTSDRRMAPCTTIRAEADELARGRMVPGPAGPELVASGRPVDPGSVRIVDPQTLAPCGADEVGEVWVSGDSVTRGYWRNPAATAEAFLDRPDGRWLRTGDLGVLHDGALFVTGRLKDVIIIRGQNRYPQDIEQDIEQGVAAVRKGRVAVFAVPFDGREGIGIAAEIGRPARRATAAADLVAAIDAVVSATQREPACLIALLDPGDLPKTTSGKLQRSACRPGLDSGALKAFALYRRPVSTRADPAAAPEADLSPQSETERRLAAIWSAVLDIETVRRSDQFLALGGHSLLAAQAAERIRQEFDVAIALSEMFSPRSLRELAAWIDRAPRRPGAEPLPPLLARRDTAVVPLSPTQQRIWASERLAGDDAPGSYNVVARISFQGDLSREALQHALSDLVGRHEILRTTYVETGEGDAVSRVEPDAALPMRSEDWTDLDSRAAGRLLSEAGADEARRPFDLGRAPLMRAALFRLGDTDHVLLVSMHHIICDGWSMAVMIRDLGAFYGTARDGLTAALPPLAIQYGDYALWQRRMQESGAFDIDKAFWRDRLADAPRVLALPTDMERPALPSHAGRDLRFSVSADLVSRLEALGRARDATLYMVLLAAFHTVLFRWSGTRDLLVGADVAGRGRPDLDPLIGFFVNVLPLRARPSADTPFDALLAAVRDDALAAFDHQALPFDQIVDAVGVPRDRSRNPLVQVLCVLQSAPAGGFGADGLTVDARQAPATTSKFDMALFLDPRREAAGQALACDWVFATDLFAEPTIERLAEAWRSLLTQIVEKPGLALGAFDLPSLETAKMSVAPSDASPAGGIRMGAKRDRLKAFAAAGTRQVADSGQEDLVRTSTLAAGATLPLVIEPTGADLDPAAWASANRETVENLLLRHGGLLFRGFAIVTPQDFEAFAEALQPGLYGGYGDLPKNEGGKNTYRSTPYPERKMILYHNESSHLPRWPRKQWFFCQEPSPVGGATPIVDCRDMYRQLPRDLAETFDRLGLTYVRTFTSRLDVDWRDFFQTGSRSAVEAQCRDAGVDFSWLAGDELQTRTRCPAVIVHPLTGERSFFNQVQLHHTRALDADVREDLLAMVGAERMPRQVFFGDGSPIPDDVMDLVGELYEACAIRFDWRRGDVVMLDNMLVAHARDPFEGPRRIVVAMGDMVDRSRLDGFAGPAEGTAR